METNKRTAHGACRSQLHTMTLQHNSCITHSVPFLSTPSTLCLKKRPTFDLLAYNLDTHDPTAIIFGRSVTEEVRNHKVLCFLTSPIYCFALPCEIRNREVSALVLCVCNTVQLLQRSRLPFSWTMPPKAPSWTQWLQDLGSRTAAWIRVVSRKTEEIKQWLLEIWQCTYTASENAMFVFPILSGSAEAQVMWGDIVKRLLIAHFIGSISVKNIKIRSRVSKLRQAKGGTFFETRCRPEIDATELGFFESYAHLRLST